MTNYEFYKDKIKEMDGKKFCDEFIQPVILKSNKKCGDIRCNYCRMLSTMWLLEEYNESELQHEGTINWAEMEIDTPVLVRDNSYEPWMKRHFAGIKDGILYAWVNGFTSFSVTEPNEDLCLEEHSISWKYMKLAKNENKKGEK